MNQSKLLRCTNCYSLTSVVSTRKPFHKKKSDILCYNKGTNNCPLLAVLMWTVLKYMPLFIIFLHLRKQIGKDKHTKKIMVANF
jgi:hypothetical protein